MVKILHQSIFVGQHLMPILHEIIADPLLFGCERGYCLRPQRGGFHADLRRQEHGAGGLCFPRNQACDPR